MKELEEIDFEDVAGSGHTKKELLLLQRELTKLESNLGGIRNMTRTPSAVWIVDTKKEHLAVDEAQKLGIPVVAILDTNCDPDEVTYPIPGNDDAIRSVNLLTRVIADAVAEGLIARNQGKSGAQAAEEPMAEWERELLEQHKAQQGEAADQSAPATEQAAEQDVEAAEAPAVEAAEAPAAEAAEAPATEAAEAPTEAPEATEAN
jgi:small subunit ribosomal protein S2